MSEQATERLLSNFFGAYFHQDWVDDAASPEDVVAEYMRTTIPSELHELNAAILELSRKFDSDAELEEYLDSTLGSYYLPSLDGISAKAWLESIASQLVVLIRDRNTSDRARRGSAQ